MTKKQELWGYAKALLSLPDIKLEEVGEIVGIANINELLVSVNKRITDSKKYLKKIHKEAESIKDAPGSSLIREEILASGTSTNLFLRNLTNLQAVLIELKAATKLKKIVLPQFRSVSHFKVGDDIMIYVGDQKKGYILSNYDWVPGLMLYPDEDWIMHCHSNEQITLSDSNGGHYFRITNQNKIFKRKDFYLLQRMLKKDPTNSLLTLLPVKVANNIVNSSVHPITDKALKEQRGIVLQEAVKIIDYFKQQIPKLLKRYKIAS